jgi:hypothetical protein
MAPIAENLTHRIFFDYVTGVVAGTSKQHTICWRLNESVTPEDAISSAQGRMLALLGNIQPAAFRAGWAVEGVRFSVAGTDISLPVDVDAALAAFVGTSVEAGWNPSSEAIQYRMEGRSPTTGVRTSMSLYGVYYPTVDADFRITPSQGSFVSDWRNALTEIGGPPLVCRDGSAVNWYNYINTQYNSYWERRIRG